VDGSSAAWVFASTGSIWTQPGMFKIRAGKIEAEDGLEESSLRYQRMMHEIHTAQRGGARPAARQR